MTLFTIYKKTIQLQLYRHIRNNNFEKLFDYVFYKIALAVFLKRLLDTHVCVCVCTHTHTRAHTYIFY